MNSTDFIKKFVTIESRLYALEPNFDERLGFVQLLKKLNTTHALPQETLDEILDLWRVRNEIVNAVQKPDLAHVAERLQSVYRYLTI